MKLGMNMLLWSTDVCGSEFDPVFAMLKDAGFDGVEIPIFDREVDEVRRPRESGSTGSASRRSRSRRRADDDNPISPDAGVRAEALVATKANLDSAAALGRRSSAGRSARRSPSSPAPAPTDEEKARAVAYLQEVGRVRRGSAA